jgi:hypothetical protein
MSQSKMRKTGGSFYLAFMRIKIWLISAMSVQPIFVDTFLLGSLRTKDSILLHPGVCHLALDSASLQAACRKLLVMERTIIVCRLALGWQDMTT